ncbi:hypothetical protein V9T40_006205 [Parthenolecanium corni]|uniref:Uncharacterized protein n=1 Tax=Parthenolecanium corni TaxID=536013 RepID=A0AAN9TTI2_9HEMI
MAQNDDAAPLRLIFSRGWLVCCTSGFFCSNREKMMDAGDVAPKTGSAVRLRRAGWLADGCPSSVQFHNLLDGALNAVGTAAQWWPYAANWWPVIAGSTRKRKKNAQQQQQINCRLDETFDFCPQVVAGRSVVGSSSSSRTLFA